MDRARQARIARRAALVLVVLMTAGYAGVSYLIASGVTAAEREEQHDHPSDYGLLYEDVEFPSRKGDVDPGGLVPAVHLLRADRHSSPRHHVEPVGRRGH